MNNTEKFSEWCLVELFGHQRLTGKVTESTIEGLIQVDIYKGDEQKPEMTQLINTKSIYRLTPITEDNSRMLAVEFSPQPISKWDVMSLLPESTSSHEDLI